MTSALLEVDGLVAGYGSGTVLGGVDLDVRHREVLAVVGRNGAGKTTLLQTIMGMVPARAGTVRLGGLDVTHAGTTAVARAGLGYVPQGRRIFPTLSVDEHLKIARRPGSWTVDAVYGLFPRLAERRRHHGDQLSGGEQQMLAVGRALLGNPRLLLLDEPSDGLAPSLVADVMNLLGQLRDGFFSVLLVEQDLGAALSVADRVAVLDRGMVVRQSAATNLDRATLEELLVPSAR
ncbi:MAG TPA: ABC transporter ATP-binding protein [Acidimicrobiia bacterium]|nr:ABC transporter ATP-binding protein [Acidimicrobiia bacterium]HTC82492.1 ABC transporter ATP-binding protein [Acidimicrobiia bacterium]